MGGGPRIRATERKKLTPDQVESSRPRSLREDWTREERFRHLGQTHALPLREFVSGLRLRFPTVEFPDFDPLDGGVDADLLFLFEKPGPMTSIAGGGSGFISRDNDDPSAEATFRFTEQPTFLESAPSFGTPSRDGTELEQLPVKNCGAV